MLCVALTGPLPAIILAVDAFPFDTLAYTRRLREGGFTEEQAEAQAEALAAAMTDTLATKQDLRELELRIDARLAQIDARFMQTESHFDARLADLERRITLRLGGIMVAGIGAVSALVKML
jgi:hypothetical protein